ncbi:MAG: hypothetical protein KJ063_06690 [Anaerolineae bacterium]|nr:hypothetical protein [Anaerolineae bacterium]
MTATADSWKTRPLPEHYAALDVDGRYTADEFTAIQQGFIPQDMDDKWFLYFADGWLNFHRSWTGSCVFRLKIEPENDYFRATTALVNRDPEQYRFQSDKFDIETIAFLIDRLLLNRFAPLPTPGKMSPEDQQRLEQHLMGQPKGDSIRLRIL